MKSPGTKFETLNKWTRIAAITGIAGTVFAEVMKMTGFELHSSLPFFHQFLEHEGNLVVDGSMAVIAHHTVKYSERRFGPFSNVKRVIGSAALMLAMGATLNAVPDTQFGMDHVGKYIYDCENPKPADDGRFCTVDSGDFTWGTVWAGFLGIAIADWRRTPPALAGQIQHIPISGPPTP